MKWILTGCLIATLHFGAWAKVRSLDELLPGLMVLTSFAHDLGDAIHSVSYAGREYPVHEATKGVLTAAGWKAREDKLELGEAWVREIVLYGSQVGEGKAELLPDGTFRFTAVAISMQGREPGRHSTRWRVQISPEGDLTAVPEQRNDPTLPGRP